MNGNHQADPEPALSEPLTAGKARSCNGPCCNNPITAKAEYCGQKCRNNMHALRRVKSLLASLSDDEIIGLIRC
jgi:hypothetical protein